MTTPNEPTGRAVADEDVRRALDIYHAAYADAASLSLSPADFARVQMDAMRATLAADRAAQATPAEGADGPLEPERIAAATRIEEALRVVGPEWVAEAQPAGAADRTRGAGDETSTWSMNAPLEPDTDLVIPSHYTRGYEEGARDAGTLRAQRYALRTVNEELRARIAELEQECATLREDKARLDWLERHTANVRKPARRGSWDMFWAFPDADDDLSDRSDLRSQIDAARAGGAW